MPGLRQDFAKLALAAADDDDDDEVDVNLIKKKAAALLQEDAPEVAPLKLREQKGATSWKTSEPKAPLSKATVVGYRAGTSVSTVNTGGGSGCVDSSAHTSYGARMPLSQPYEGPAINREAGADVDKTSGTFQKPPLLSTGPALSTFGTELNKVRKDPVRYADSLLAFRPFFEGTILHNARGEGSSSTVEGVAALDELCAFLRKQTPFPELKQLAALDEAANDMDKLSEYGTSEGLVRDFTANKVTCADEALLKILCSDGDKMRRGRRLLDRRMTRCGVSTIQPDRLRCILCQTFRPKPKRTKLQYQGFPVKDDDFLELLLALPEPLPIDLTRKLKQNHCIAIDASQADVTIVSDLTDGTSIQVGSIDA